MAGKKSFAPPGVTEEMAQALGEAAVESIREERGVEEIRPRMPLVKQLPVEKSDEVVSQDDLPPTLRSAAIAFLETAPVNSKLVITENRTAAIGTPGGEVPVEKADPARRHLPSMATIRRVGETRFIGFVPHGAARDVREHVVERSSAAATFREMVRLIQGE